MGIDTGTIITSQGYNYWLKPFGSEPEYDNDTPDWAKRFTEHEQKSWNDYANKNQKNLDDLAAPWNDKKSVTQNIAKKFESSAKFVNDSVDYAGEATGINHVVNEYTPQFIQDGQDKARQWARDGIYGIAGNDPDRLAVAAAVDAAVDVVADSRMPGKGNKAGRGGKGHHDRGDGTGANNSKRNNDSGSGSGGRRGGNGDGGNNGNGGGRNGGHNNHNNGNGGGNGNHGNPPNGGGGGSGSNGGRFPTNFYRKKSDTPSPRKYDPARPDASKKPDVPTPHKPDVSKTPNDRKGIDNNKKPDIDKKPDTPKRNPEREKIVVDFDKSKEKGTSENDLVNNLKPNTDYELTNGTEFSTNEHGYVDRISFRPDFDNPGTRDSRQTDVGKEGKIGDVGGHIQACLFGGTCDRYNLFPQDGNFNNSTFKSEYENIVIRAHKNGKRIENVTINFTRNNPSSPRPDSLTVTFIIDGQKTKVFFKNEYRGGM